MLMLCWKVRCPSWGWCVSTRSVHATCAAAQSDGCSTADTAYVRVQGWKAVFPIRTSHSDYLQPFEEIPTVFIKNVESLSIRAGLLKSQALPLAGHMSLAQELLGEALQLSYEEIKPGHGLFWPE